MSRGAWSDTDKLALEFECEYCHERPGKWCRAVRINGTDLEYPQGEGPLASWLHAARTGPIFDAYHLGADARAEHVVYVVTHRIDRALEALRNDPGQMTTFGAFADWLELRNLAGNL